jgi:hypothetical protein
VPDNFELALDAAGELSVFHNTTAWPRAWLAQTRDAPPNEALGSVAVDSRTANQLTLRVDALQPAWLVLSEMAYPTRQLVVDAVPVPTETSGWGPSVQLSAGPHIVQYRYQATPFRTGVWLAIAALVVTLSLSLFGSRLSLQIFAEQ